MSAGAEVDVEHMNRAVAAAARVRLATSPRPWVGAVVVSEDGAVFEGATDGQRGPHAEVMALRAAGPQRAKGATLYTTLEPCSHWGRTPPCAEAVIEAEVRRVVVACPDPDPKVAGRGLAQLVEAGVKVAVGVGAEDVEEQLRPYLHHRRTGRPWVVLKLAATLDGRTAAPDGTSRWITGPEARADAHLLRAASDAVLVGAGTVRDDDPALTVRDLPPDAAVLPRRPDGPLRVVLGRAPPTPGCIRVWRWPATSKTCSTSWGDVTSCSCWWRAAPAWPVRSTAGTSSTTTSSTWLRRCSGATTRCRSSGGPGRRRSTSCGGAGPSP